MQKILSQVQDLENAGYEFEAAEASFDLLVKKAAGLYRPWFERLAYRVNIEADADGAPLTEATVKVRVGDQVDAHGQRGRRPGERAGRRAAQGAAAVLSAAGGDAPGRLQGARGERPGGDGGAGARGDRVARRRRRVGHGRRQREHHRGELAGAGGCGRVQAVQGRRNAGRRRRRRRHEQPTTETAATPAPTVAVEKDDPWRYGWRYVRATGPDGRIEYDQVPLAAGGPAVPGGGRLHREQPTSTTRTAITSRPCWSIWPTGRDGDCAARPPRGLGSRRPAAAGPGCRGLRRLREAWDPSRGTFPVRTFGRPDAAGDRGHVAGHAGRTIWTSRSTSTTGSACLYYAIVDRHESRRRSRDSR